MIRSLDNKIMAPLTFFSLHATFLFTGEVRITIQKNTRTQDFTMSLRFCQYIFSSLRVQIFFFLNKVYFFILEVLEPGFSSQGAYPHDPEKILSFDERIPCKKINYFFIKKENTTFEKWNKKEGRKINASSRAPILFRFYLT